MTVKQIAAREDVDVSPWTVKRWLKKFCIKPDQKGHGPDKYKFTTATNFVKLFNDFYKANGTTPQIARAKFAGKLKDTNQLPLPFTFHAIKKIITQKIQQAEKIVKVRANGKARRRA